MPAGRAQANSLLLMHRSCSSPRAAKLGSVPERLLSAMERDLRVSRSSTSGTPPVRSALLRLTTLSEMMSKSSEGIVPPSGLLSRRRRMRLDRLVRPARPGPAVGMEPVSELSLSTRFSRLTRPEKSGSGPESWLLHARREVRLAMEATSSGMEVKSLLHTSSSTRAVSSPISVGMSPTKELSARLMRVSEVIKPISVGREPVKSLSWRLSSFRSVR
mmetsp:Transcript_17750/g.55434  ORF Transcript_17750/g.55434 Transcript_17750/m.55434 type:complete len:217 (+) Transcript_17750:1057-1707(+)